MQERSSVFSRNKSLIGVVAAAFGSTLMISGLVAYVSFVVAPSVLGFLETLFRSETGFIAIPPPYSPDLYRFIFLNNTGHFWNPARMGVWIPLGGAAFLGFELLLNAAVIGGVAVFAGLTRGPLFAIAGLLPHGVIEIPAFILEFASMAQWHITSTRAVYAKLSGRSVDRAQFKQGLMDALTLAVLSVVLFAAAAYVESYVTPSLLEAVR